MCEHALNAGCISIRNAMGVTISIFSKHLFKGITWTSFIVSGLCVILMDLYSFGEKKKKTPTHAVILSHRYLRYKVRRKVTFLVDT